MIKWLTGLLLHFIPKNHLSYVVGKLVRIKKPRFFSRFVMRAFVAYFEIDMWEAEKPLESYDSFGDLFVRRLKEGIRPISEGLIHPVDAELTQIESIQSEHLIQAKGKFYRINEFLYSNEGFQIFKGGLALTYYLCPTDYHRTHSPVTGEIEKVSYVPGRLWPVNSWSVKNISHLFSINERVVIWVKTPQGPVAYVMVGATNVGQMSLSFDHKIVTNQYPFAKEPFLKMYEPPLAIEKGDELGLFNMGSTVIVLYPENYQIDAKKVRRGKVKLGEALY